MNPVRVLVVDDEPLARAGLRAILGEEPGVAIVGESVCGEDAVSAVRALAPDVVFLDIALPDLDGFGVVERLAPDRRPEVVFVTAHSDQALRAYEVRALDYVTKPLRRDRVREALARTRERVRLGRLDRTPARPSEPRAPLTAPLALKADGRIRLVDQRTIDWISADDDHVVVHAAAHAVRARETLRRLERRLDATSFVRIHRSTIVRLDRIREMQPWFHGDYVVMLHGGAKLRLSRNFRDGVSERLGREL